MVSLLSSEGLGQWSLLLSGNRCQRRRRSSSSAVVIIVAIIGLSRCRHRLWPAFMVVVVVVSRGRRRDLGCVVVVVGRGRL